jgi:hypothetical protein
VDHDQKSNGNARGRSVIWALLISPLGRRIALAVGIVALALGIRWYFLSEGQRQGRLDALQESSNSSQVQRDADRKNTETVLSRYDSLLAQYDEKLKAAETRVARAEVALVTVKAQQQQAASDVAGVSDSSIHKFVKSQLGATDSGPFTLPEERSLATCMSQYPLCQKEADAQRDRADASEEQIHAIDGKVDTLSAKFDALAGYTVRLEGAYTALWNQASQSKRAWKCLKLWKCDRPQITAPDPAALTGQHPQ